MSDSKEVTVHQPSKAELTIGSKVAPIVPRNVDEVARVAKAVIVAGLAPDSYRGRDDQETASKTMIGIMAGAEVGFAPMMALKNIAIINNRPCIWGDGAVALVQSSGKVEKWEEVFSGDQGTDGFTATCAIWRKGQEVPYEGRFSIGDAKRAKLLTKQPWILYPSRMLMWRARTYAMRNGFADFLAGLGIAEEVMDLPAPPKPVDTSFLEADTPAEEEPSTQPAEAA